MKKFRVILFGLLIVSSLLVTSVSSELKTIKIQDGSSSQNTSTLSIGDTTPISPTSGTFDDPQEISMVAGGVYRTGSLDFELNSTFQELVFKFDINDTSPVKVTISSSGAAIDLNQYEIYFVILDPLYNFIVDKSSLDFSLPMSVDFPASTTGYYILDIFGNNLDTYQLTSGEVLGLNATIEHYKKGQVRPGETSQLIQSVAFSTIQSMNDFLGTSGYIGEINNVFTTNIGDLDPNDPSFAKTIGLSVYGLCKAAQYMAKAGNQQYNQQIMVQYWNLAYNLWLKAVNSILESSRHLFYFRYAESNIGLTNYVTYLSDNAYMLMALGELDYMTSPWFIVDPVNDLTYDFTYDLTFIHNHFLELANSTIAMFETSPGQFQERLSIVDYNEANAVAFNVSDAFNSSYYASVSNSNYTTLESYALLAESYYWQSSLYFGTPAEAKFNGKRDDLVAFVEANMKLTTVDGAILLPEGIFAEFYNLNTSSPSQTATLISNSFYVSNLNTYAKDFGIYAYPQSEPYIGSSPFAILTHASNVMENVLRAFDHPGDGLLYDEINATDSTKSEKILSNIGNSAAVFALNRLGINWEEVQNASPTPSGETTTRTWKIRSLLTSNDMFNTFYDQLNNFMFSEYDDKGNQFVADDNFAESNLMLSNTYMMAIISDLFPVEMSAITQKDLIVGNKGQLTLELGQITTDGTWIWWDPFKPFKVNAHITIPEFGFDQLLEVDLASGFGLGGDKITLPFFYDVVKRGSYTVNIDLSTEGVVLLSQSIDMTALGTAVPEFSLQKFAVTDDEFETSIAFVDETGLSVSSLQVKGALGQAIDTSQTDFGNKYIRTGRTDSSGNLALTFNVKDLVSDGLLNLTEIYNRANVPPFVSLKLYLNLTNADSFNFETRQYSLDVVIDLKRVNLRTSPTNLEITQGTTDSFSFTVTALDQDQVPIPNADLSYKVKEVPFIQNKVFTDADGEATITFRDNDLFGLSNLAYLHNVDNTDILSPTNATIQISFAAQNYPNKTVSRTLNIMPNNLVITANPVQFTFKEKTILDTTTKPLEIEVAVSDLFSRVVNAYVHVEWPNDTRKDELNKKVNLDDLGRHISPYSFSVDPSKLKAGKYTFLIVAEKDGITTTFAVNAQVPNSNLGLSQSNVKTRPAITPRTIIIEKSTTQDIIISGASVLGALILARGGGIAYEFLTDLRKVECPNCKEKVRKGISICSHCGRDTGFGKKESSTPPEMPEPPAKNLEE